MNNVRFTINQRGKRRSVTRNLFLSCFFLGGLASIVLPGCRPVLYQSPPAFIGNFDGYAKPAEGPAVGLSITTTLISKETLIYTFEGEAILGGAHYRIEGAEESNGVVSYLAVPPVNGLSATFYDDAGVARYDLFMRVFYSGSLHEMTFEGRLYEAAGGAHYGVVFLQRTR